MTGVAIERLPFGPMAVETEIHIDSHQGLTRRALGSCDVAVAVPTLQLGYPDMAAVAVVHVRGKPKQLVEAQRISPGEEGGDPGRLGRGALWCLVARAADCRVGKARMGAGTRLLVTELTIEPEILGVLEVVECDRLRYRCSTAHRRPQHH